jgi:hypothetical protein
MEKATAGRFFLASLVLHCILLLILGTIGLGVAIIGDIQGPDTATASSQMFGDAAKQQPFERVADLRSLDAAPVPELIRQITTPQNVPSHNVAPVATVPVQTANILPATRDDFVPPRQPAPARPLDNLQRQTRADPTRLADIRPVPTELPPPGATAQERPLEGQQVDQPRQDSQAPPDPALQPPRSPNPVATNRLPAVDLNPAEPKPPQMRELVVTPVSPVLNRQPIRSVGAAALKEDVTLVTRKSTDNPNLLTPMGTNVAVDRPEPAAPGNEPAPSPGSLINLKADAFQPGIHEPPQRPETPSPLLKPLLDPLVRTSNRPGPGPVDTGLPPDQLALKGMESPREKPLTGSPLSLPRRTATPPALPVRTPNELAGPAVPDETRVSIGRLSDREVDAQPNVNPLTGGPLRRIAPTDHVARLNEEAPALNPFMLRRQDIRPEAVKRFGGTPESEAAVEHGLQWLATHQGRDGSWSLNKFHTNCQGHGRCSGGGNENSDAAATALALLPFLVAGHTHRTAGKYQQNVARGLKWFVEHQSKDGRLDSGGRQMYGHGLATIALCEAYGMTKDPALKEPAQKAVDFIVKAQHPRTGGWRYQPGDSGDTSVFGWQVMALKNGEAAGLTIPDKTWEGAKRWLASVEGNRPVGGLFGYTSPSPSSAMTAQGLLALQLMGIRRDDPRMQAGADYLLKHLPRRGSDSSYYWYHATQVMYHMQGKHWEAWNEKIRDLLVATQETKGGLAGSWDPVDSYEKAGGRIYSTSLRILMLEAYYRHMPLYQVRR